MVYMGGVQNRPIGDRFRTAVHDLRRVGLNAEHKSWGFKLYHQDAAGSALAECREELDESISLELSINGMPPRWFFRRELSGIVDLLTLALAESRAGNAPSLAAAIDAAEAAFDRDEMLRKLYSGKGPFAALLLSLPQEYFPDDDDIRVKATEHVCRQLEAHLLANGHCIPDWVRGGCQEDWGVCLRSQRGEVHYDYQIKFYPRGNDTRSLAIMYGTNVGFWRRIFHCQPQLGADDPLHQVIWEFGAKHERPQLLTQAQVNADRAQPHPRD